ncbi:hypothetical protein [Kitasatospora indigofera]|uniref:hypothetical protein n=1 Tax=Kitasatospora indigofera TaxID=67307 RepID=UPI0036A31B55
MSDFYDYEAENPPVRSSPRGSRIRMPALLLAGVLVAGALFGAGYLVGHGGQADSPATASPKCVDAMSTANDLLKKNKQQGADSVGGQQSARLASNVIIQNPECFSAAMRAVAQEGLNRVMENAQMEAARCASARTFADRLGC